MTVTEEVPPMTGAEMKASREFMGLSLAWMSRYLMCDQRRLLRMEMGKEPIPNRLAGKFDDLYEATGQVVADLIHKYSALIEERASGEATLPVYRNDDEYQRDGKRKVDPTGQYGALWYRMVAQRVADAVPGVVLVYREPTGRHKPPKWEQANA
jgi:hypothetical protein